MSQINNNERFQRVSVPGKHMVLLWTNTQKQKINLLAQCTTQSAKNREVPLSRGDGSSQAPSSLTVSPITSDTNSWHFLKAAAETKEGDRMEFLSYGQKCKPLSFGFC